MSPYYTNTDFFYLNGLSELRRSADASLLVIEVLMNLSNGEEGKNSPEFFEIRRIERKRNLRIRRTQPEFFEFPNHNLY